MKWPGGIKRWATTAYGLDQNKDGEEDGHTLAPTPIDLPASPHDRAKSAFHQHRADR